MLHKTIIPLASQIGGLSPVLILKISSKGLDKTAAMQKRAAAFALVIANIKPMLKKAYLHVITTGDYLHYGPNRNADAWNGHSFTHRAPMPKTASVRDVTLDLGLSKYHLTYLDNAAVYQLHQTNRLGQKPSGIIKAAKYNLDMHRGLLLIEVDTDAWATRLSKKAAGQDIFLSVGADLLSDLCSVCHNRAHSLDEHCEHILHKNGSLLEDGTRVCMFNDAPHFYDISGVNVPADQMAFVLRKVASGVPVNTAIMDTRICNMTRPALAMNKLAGILNKLSNILKKIICKTDDDPIFTDEDLAVDDFLKAVENYPSLLIIDQCNRKAILLSPKMLFKIIGKESPNRDMFDTFADKCPCCGAHIMQDMLNDPHFGGNLSDGSFDSILPPDINLANILLSFIPDFGVSRPALGGKSIRITIRLGTKPKDEMALVNKMQDDKSLELDSQAEELLKLKFLKPLDEEPKKLKAELKDLKLEDLKEDMLKKASLVNDLFRRTYARYVLSFASRNSDDTCNLAMQKVARYR